MNAERFGDATEKINRRIFRLPLDAAHMGAVNSGLISQFLLRNAALHTDPTHIPGHNCTSFHVPSIPFVHAVKPLAIIQLLSQDFVKSIPAHGIVEIS